MSISNEVQKLKQTLKDSYSALESKGIILPEDQNYDNLAAAIESVHTDVHNSPLTIEPQTVQQTFITSQEYSGYNTVIAEAVTAAIDTDIKSENILKGVTILEVRGSIVLDETTISPSTVLQTLTHEGVGGYATVVAEPVTAAIDTDIKAENIRAGVEILGVEGTVIESSTHAVTFTENGTYVPEEGYTGFSEVKVDVEDISPVYIGYLDEIETVMEEYSIPVTGDYSLLSSDLDTYLDDLSDDLETIVEGGTGDPTFTILVGQTATFTESGTYGPAIGYTGFTSVEVDVPETLLEDITVTENGVYVADSGYDGIASVEVDVPEPMLEDMTVTVNGTFTAGSGYDGINSIKVSVEEHSEPVLEDMTVTANGTYAAGSGYDGLGTVVVNTPTNYGPNREISAQGVYQIPANSFTFTLPQSATDIGTRAMYYAFENCTGVTSANLSSLITLSGESAMYMAFYGCSNLISVDLSNLVSITAQGAMYLAFKYCESLISVNLSNLTTLSSVNSMNSAFDGTALSNVDLSSLTTVSGSGALRCAFYNCESLTSVDLSSLTTLSGSGALIYAFRGCTSLSSLSFPSLNSNSFGSIYTNQFENMLSGVTGCTVHFPSNLQSVIGSWSDVTNGFGGTNTTVLFDLPATT